MATRAKSQKKEREIKMHSADTLSGMPWLLHGFSTRHGGVSEAYGGRALNLGITKEDTRAAVEKNRALFLEHLGALDEDGRIWPSIAMRQVHSSLIHHIDEIPAQAIHGDGLITNRAGIVLSVRVADCLPVLLVDPARRAVGAFHAGWRGTLSRFVEKGVGEFRRYFGSDPAEIKAAIGPGIHRCCYEVSEDLRDKFRAQFSYADGLIEEVFLPIRCAANIRCCS